MNSRAFILLFHFDGCIHLHLWHYPIYSLDKFHNQDCCYFFRKQICESTLGEPLQSNHIIVSPRNHSEYEVKGGLPFPAPSLVQSSVTSIHFKEGRMICYLCLKPLLPLKPSLLHIFAWINHKRTIPPVSMDPGTLRIQFKRQLWNTTQQWKGTN